MLAGTESDKERKYHLTFERKHKPKGKKTNIYKVYNSKDTWIRLGDIKWHVHSGNIVFILYQIPCLVKVVWN